MNSDSVISIVFSLFQNYADNHFIYTFEVKNLLNFEFFNNVLKKTFIIQYNTDNKIFSLKTKDSIDTLIESQYINDLLTTFSRLI